MGNAIEETNEMILDAEEKNREGNDGSNVLSLQDTVTKQAKTRAERKAEFEREADEICKRIDEDCVKSGIKITDKDIEDVWEEMREESRERYEGLTIIEVAKLMDKDTKETMAKLREEFGEDFFRPKAR
jgi:predicted metalloprotease